MAEFNFRESVTQGIKEAGGWTNAHAHADRAYTITPETLHLSRLSLKDKWSAVDQIKRDSTSTDVYDRMARVAENMLHQGVTAFGTFIDVDEAIRDRAIMAALRLRETFGRDIDLVFANQALKGVLDPEASVWFNVAAEFVDIIGGLPARDKGREREHLDVLLETAKWRGKMVHVHVDQNNTPQERETELLIDKVREHGMEGKVVGVHGISIAAQPLDYRNWLYSQMEDVGLGMIACPWAWIDDQRLEESAPIHNALTPIDEMIPRGITVALGTDNILDIYKPSSEGEMWPELKLLYDGNHYYDMEQIIRVGSVNGRLLLGLPIRSPIHSNGAVKVS
ncbi:MAG: amidohydrolase family protein [Candidatus Daviesbacteria bacterium]|nr:amidohydrolase family protein [Candidatus Daviesbacteria bacterium]